MLLARREYHEFRGEMRRAVEALDESLAVAATFQPPFVLAQMHLGSISTYMEAGDTARGRAVRREWSAQLQPPFDGLLGLGDLAIALALEDPPAAREAIAGLERFIAAYNQQALEPALMWARAEIHEMEGALEEALGAYQEYLAQDPGDVDVHSAMARVLRELGRLDEAEREAREVLRRVPVDPEALLELARALEAADRRDEAREALERALEVWRDADVGYRLAAEARALRDGG